MCTEAADKDHAVEVLAWVAHSLGSENGPDPEGPISIHEAPSGPQQNPRRPGNPG